MDQPAVEVNDLVMRYGDVTAVDGLSLTVRAGTVTAILGPNGAGKTTTLETCEGFRRPQSGSVRVLGSDPHADARSLRPRVGVMLQSGGAWSGVRTEEMLRHVASLHAHPLDVGELVERLGLGAAGRTPYRRLSGGQQQRLSLAMAVVGRPELLFLDEPTAGFDPQARRDFHELVHRLSDLEGTTILLTTHDLAEAEKLADRILILDGGRIVADGSPDELSRQVAGTSEVRWARGAERFVHPTDDVVGFVRRLFEQEGDSLTDLEVRKASLEDTYLAMVERSRSASAPTPHLQEVAR